MSATYSVTLINSEGQAQTGKDVDLYEGDGSGAKTGDFTEVGNGTYKITVSSAGKYTVKVGGVIQSELQSMYVPVDDILTASDVVNDLTTGGVAVPLSAEQGKTLNTNKVNVSDIVNDLTTGGTTKPLSAEQGKTLNTNKVETSVIGNRTYTKNNVVTNSETITASIDAIDKAIGNFETVESDAIMAAWYRSLLASPGYPNLVSLLRCLSHFEYSTRLMVTSGTAINDVRVIYADSTVAANESGSNAAALPASAETGGGETIKRRGVYWKLVTDKYVRIKFSAILTNNIEGFVKYYDQQASVQAIISSSGYQNMELDISALPNETVEWYLTTKVYSGTGSITIKYVEITVCGA